MTEEDNYILELQDDEIGFLPRALAMRVRKGKPGKLTELTEKIRKGETSIGSILVEQNKSKVSIGSILAEANRVKRHTALTQDERELREYRDNAILEYLKSHPRTSPNEERLSEEVGNLLSSGRWSIKNPLTGAEKGEGDLRPPTYTNDLRIVKSLASGGEAAHIVSDPIIREAYQKSSAIDGTDTDKIVALKANLTFLGKTRALSNRAQAYLRQIVDNIQLNRERHDDTVALRLFRAEFLDLNASSDSNVTITPAGGSHRLPEGELPRPGQDTIEPSDSSSEGAVTGKRGIGTVPAPIPRRGVTVPTDSPRALSEREMVWNQLYQTTPSLDTEELRILLGQARSMRKNREARGE
jgi:hypothetical protein